MGSYRNGQWEPKFDFAEDRAGPLGDPDNPGYDPRPEAWVAAPADSHVEKFRYTDARENSFVRKFGDGVAAYGKGRSQLAIVFKPQQTAKGTRPRTEYWYWFDDHAEGRRVFDLLCAAEHPGEVVHAELIKKGVSYTKQS